MNGKNASAAASTPAASTENRHETSTPRDRCAGFCAGSVAKRFWPKVARGRKSDCWPWLGGKRRKGYGGFFLNGTTVSAHRMAWELANQLELPAGAMVLHACDNPACCNPWHLSSGTAKRNHDEKVERGRAFVPRGSKHGRSKLTEAQVVEMRAYATRGVSLRSLAADYGVTVQTAREIVNREAWRHVA